MTLAWQFIATEIKDARNWVKHLPIGTKRA